MSWPIIVAISVYTFISLVVFNDFMQHVTSTEYVSVSSLETPEQNYSEVLPLSSYVPHADGDILNVTN